jgi:hypothetical protein
MMDPQSHEISDHAKFQMKRRGISENMVDTVLKNPEQVIESISGRKILQSRFSFSEREEIKHHLVRVVVDSRAEPPKVVTVYRTSRIEKYWREK